MTEIPNSFWLLVILRRAQDGELAEPFENWSLFGHLVIVSWLFVLVIQPLPILPNFSAYQRQCL